MSAGGNTYTCNDNGNLLSGAGRTLTWTSFNQSKTVATTTTTTFAYGPERARIRQPDQPCGGAPTKKKIKSRRRPMSMKVRRSHHRIR